jgi:NAD(P)-dependent dehydrogenase (short-subunit alcohol dehydrogenase family)
MSPQSIHAFAEKVALITDGSGRIGKAAALQLALQGCFVIVGYPDISPEEESAINELKSLGTLAGAVKADISTAAGAKNLVEAVHKLYGRLDLLVNCMKFMPESSFENTSEETFSRIVDANVRSVFFVIQAALEMMKDRPKPRIVNVISACDTPDTAGNAAFSLSQPAVAELTRSLAGALPAKFRVNCVAVSEKARASNDAGNDLFRLDKGVPADEVARVILYLLSGEAAGLNGQILTVE